MNLDSLDSESLNILEEITNASQRFGHPNSSLKVDILLKSGWCESQDLIMAFKQLEENNLEMVMAFFQLPFIVRLPEKWISIKAAYGEPTVYFRTIGTEYNNLRTGDKFHLEQRESYSSIENITNGYLINDNYGILVRTQVLMLFHLWGRRQQFYDRYLIACSKEHSFKSVIVTSEYSWVDDTRPLTCATYEVDVAKRIRREAFDSIYSFIDNYSIVCKDANAQSFKLMNTSAKTKKHLDSFFVMTKTGRIVIPDIGTSMIAKYVKPFKPFDYSDNLKALENYVKRNKLPTIYEQYLVEAAREIDHGNPDLAIVQSVMILEWFANELIESHLFMRLRKSLEQTPELAKLAQNLLGETKTGKIRIPIRERFKKYLPLIGITLPDRLDKRFHKLVQIRDSIVHAFKKQTYSAEIATQSIDTAMEIIQFSMDRIIERFEVLK